LERAGPVDAKLTCDGPLHLDDAHLKIDGQRRIDGEAIVDGLAWCEIGPQRAHHPLGVARGLYVASNGVAAWRGGDVHTGEVQPEAHQSGNLARTVGGGADRQVDLDDRCAAFAQRGDGGVAGSHTENEEAAGTSGAHLGDFGVGCENTGRRLGERDHAADANTEGEGHAAGTCDLGLKLRVLGGRLSGGLRGIGRDCGIGREGDVPDCLVDVVVMVMMEHRVRGSAGNGCAAQCE
jgi:hypothetical protein